MDPIVHHTLDLILDPIFEFYEDLAELKTISAANPLECAAATPHIRAISPSPFIRRVHCKHLVSFVSFH